MKLGTDLKDSQMEMKYQQCFSLDQRKMRLFILGITFLVLLSKGFRTALLLAEVGDLNNNIDFFYLYPICTVTILLLFFAALVLVERISWLKRNNEIFFISVLGVGFLCYSLFTWKFNLTITGNYQYWVGIESQSYLLIALFVFKTIKVRIITLLAVLAIQMAENLRSKEDLVCQITLWCMSTAILVLIIISEKQQKEIFKHFYSTRKNFMKILDVLPNSVIVLDSKRRAVFANDFSQAMFLNEVKEPSPFRRDLIYHRLCSKFKKLTLRSDFGREKAADTKDQEPRSPKINSLSFVDIRSIDGSCKSKIQQIEDSLHSVSIEKAVETLLENENFFRENNLHINSNTCEHYFFTFEASSELRTFEINITFTSNRMAGSLLMIVHETTLLNQINFYKLQEKSRSLALASISHELRNPLNGSLCLIECAADDTALPTHIAQTFLIPAINTMKMMQSLVNDILDYSQINENKFKLVFQEIDLRQVIYDTISVVNMQATNKGLTIRVQISEEVPAFWNSDPKRLSQILLNLLSNALKFTKKGKITISAKLYDFNVNLLEISVEDTGIGMKKSDVNRLFKENFMKIDLGENAYLNSSGCGLGLNIANKLAIALGRGQVDHIKVSSQEGKGSVFSFVIENKITSSSHALSPTISISRYHGNIPKPTIYKASTHSPSIIDDEIITTDYVSHLDEQISHEERHVFKLPTHSRFMKEKPQGHTQGLLKNSSLSVLIVDDDTFNVYSLQTVLKTFGLNAAVAYNGTQAIEQLETELMNRKIADQEASLKGQVKIIFMDANMPLMNGIETAEYIKSNFLNKNLMQIVIIGVTGDSETHLHEKMISAGVTEILLKPITKKDIQNVLEKYGQISGQ